MASTTLPAPATISLNGHEVHRGLRITSEVRAPCDGVEQEECGSLECGAPGNLLWSAPAREVLGATAIEGVLQVHVVLFSGQGKDRKLVDSDSREDLPAGIWHLKAERVDHEVNLGDVTLARTWAAAIKQWAHCAPRTIHVLVNPFSGTGKGAEIWRDIVKPVLELSPHTIMAHMTTGAGDATQYVKEAELPSNAIVAALGGDGTMSEVTNGLMARSDARQGAFTVCFVPGGSSNAMAHLTGCGDSLTAAWALAKGRLRSMDLFALHQGQFDDNTGQFQASASPKFGFLSMTGGLIADIDIDSEVFRCCGEPRYTAYAVSKIFCCCCCACFAKVHSRIRYSYRLRWLPQHKGANSVAAVPSHPQLSPSGPGWESWEGELNFFQLLAAPAISRTTHCGRGTALDDGTLNLQWKTPGGRLGLVKQFDLMDAGTHICDEDGSRRTAQDWQQQDVRAVCVDRLEPDSKVVIDGENLKPGTSWFAEVLPRFVSVVVGSGPLKAFDPTPHAASPPEQVRMEMQNGADQQLLG